MKQRRNCDDIGLDKEIRDTSHKMSISLCHLTPANQNTTSNKIAFIKKQIMTRQVY